MAKKQDIQLRISAKNETTPAFNSVRKSYQNVQAGLKEFSEQAQKVEGTGKKAKAEAQALYNTLKNGLKAEDVKLAGVMDGLARGADSLGRSAKRNGAEIDYLQKRIERLNKIKARADVVVTSKTSAANAAAVARAEAATKLNDKLTRAKRSTKVAVEAGAAPEDLAKLREKERLIRAQIKANKELSASEKSLAMAQSRATGLSRATDTEISRKTRLLKLNEDIARQEARNARDSASADRRRREISKLEAMAPQQLAARGQRVPEGFTKYSSGFDRLAGAGLGMREAKQDAAGLEGALKGVANRLMAIAAVSTLVYTSLNQMGEVIGVFRNLQAFDSRMNFANSGDAAKTARDMDYVRASADKYGISLAKLTEDYARFAVAAQASGMKAKEVKVVFDGVMAAARVNKLTDDAISRSFYALQQMISKGTVSSEELRQQLGEAMPGAVAMFARALGYTSDTMGDFFKKLGDGQIMARDAVQKFGSFLSTEYAASVALAANSFEANLARFKSSIFDARAEFAKSGFMDGLSKGMAEVTAFFKSDAGKVWFRQLGQAAGSLVQAFAMIARYLPEIMIALSGLAAARVVSMTRGMIAGIAAAPTAAAVAGGAGVMGQSNPAQVGKATKAMQGLGKAVTGVGAALGGLPTLVAAVAVGGLMLWSNQNAQRLEKLSQQVDGGKALIREIQLAAQEAQGDVNAFASSLGTLRDMTKEQRATEMEGVRVAVVQTIDDLDSKINKGANANIDRNLSQDGLSFLNMAKRQRDIAAARQFESEIQAVRDQLVLGEKDAKAFGEAASEIGAKYKVPADIIAEIQSAATVFEMTAGGYKDVNNAAKVLNGTLDEQSAVMKEIADGSVVSDQMVEKYKEQADAVKRITENLKKLATEGSKLGQALSIEDEIAQSRAAIRSMHEDLKKTFDPVQYERLSARMAEAVQQNLSKIDGMSLNFTLSNSGVSTEYGSETAGYFRGQMPQASTPSSEAGQKIFNGLLERGLPEHLAKAFVINFQDESRLNPGIEESVANVHGTKGYGLGQWTGSRRTDLEKYAKSQSKPINDLEMQLDFLMTEVKGPERRAANEAMSADSVGKAADILVRKFFRPAKEHEVERSARYLRTGDDAVANLATDEERLDRPQIELSRTDQARIGTIDPFLKDLPKAISDPIAAAILASGREEELAKDNLFTATLAEGNIPDIVELLEDKGFGELATRIEESSAAAIAAASTTRRMEIYDEYQDLVKGLKNSFNGADLLEDGAMDRAVNERVSEVIKEVEALGGSLQELTGTTSDQAAKAAIAGEARIEAEKAFNAQLAEQAKKDAAAREKFIANAVDEEARTKQRADIEAMPDGQVKDRALAELKVKDMERTGNAALPSDVRASIAEAEFLRLQVATNEKLKKTADDDKKKAQEDRMEILQIELGQAEERLQFLRDQLAKARESGDAATERTVTDKIREEEAAVRSARDALIAYHTELATPQDRASAATLTRTSQSSVSLDTENLEAGQERVRESMRKTGDVISNSLTGSVSAFSQAVANGEGVWQSLAGAVKSAIAQMLIEIGQMIVQTIIANAIMTAMGFPPGGAQGAQGGMGGGGSGNMMGSFFGALFSAGMPTFHQGGVAGERGVRTSLADIASGGLRSNELIALVEEDEEIITRDDPRHRYNGGLKMKVRTYHSGGIAGMDADKVNRSIASTRTDLSKSVEMFQNPNSGASEPNVRVVNLFESSEMTNAGLSGPDGEKVVMNFVSKNRAKIRAMLK